MVGTSSNTSALITKATCCVSFLIIMAVWAAISIHTWTMVVPDWKMFVIGATLMGYPISDLLNSFSIGKK